MARATGGRCSLTDLHLDVEHHYHSFLPIREVCKLGGVCRTLHEHVRVSLRSYSWHVVHCEGDDPGPLTWLTGIAKLDVNVRSIKMVSSLYEQLLGLRIAHNAAFN